MEKPGASSRKPSSWTIWPVPKLAGILSMQRSRKEMHVILKELKSFFQDCNSQRDARVVNDCLEPVGERFDPELREKVAEILTPLNVGFQAASV